MKDHGINTPFDRWYVVRAEEYIRASTKKLRDHTLSDLESWLSVLGRDSGLKDWQLRQAAIAIRVLHCEMISHEWACEFDWDGWHATAKSLPSSHPTLARDYESNRNLQSDTGAKGHDSSVPAILADGHQQLLDSLVREIRRRDYAIRTEQTYLHWVKRFLLFSQSSKHSEVDAESAFAFFDADQGAQFTGNAFTRVLKGHKIRISMDGKGRALDNLFIERLWQSVKYEEIYLKEYRDVSDLKRSLKKYFHFYNTERPHQSLENQTPAEFDRKEAELRVAASI